MIVAALVAAELFLLGTNAVEPLRLATAPIDRRRRFGLAVLPLLLLALFLALLHLRIAPDAALAAGIFWPPRSPVARLLLISLGAGAAAAVLVAIGWRRFEPAAWRAAAGLAAILAAGAAVAGELLALSGAVSGGLLAVLGASSGRFAVTLAAGECATGRPGWFATLAAIALPLSRLFAPLPSAAAQALRVDLLTLGAAALLLLVARFLEARAGRLTALLGVLLAALYFARLAEVAATIPPLPGSPIAP